MNFRAEVYTAEQLRQALDNPHIEMVYAPYSIIKDEHCSHIEKIILIPPLYLADCEDSVKESLIHLKNLGFANALVHTIGHIELLSALGFNLYGGYRLNCLNSESAAFFQENNVNDIIASPEMTASDIDKLDAARIGFIAYGYLPLMITRRCPIKNGKPCKEQCCNRTVTDRKGNKLNVICSENTSEILNSDVLYLADRLKSFRKADFAVLKFTVEKNIVEIITEYTDSQPAKMKNFTRGLYFRGIKE